MLKIYGHPGSRAARPLWVCRELGLQHEHVPTHFADGGTQSAEFLAINPAGRIPAIDDDGFRLAESMAINIYLAKKHGGELAPKSLEDEARMLQWSFWAMTEVEKLLLTLYMQRAQLPPGSEIEKADLNVASVLSMGLAAKFDIAAYPNLQQWLNRCVSRPAARPPKKS